MKHKHCETIKAWADGAEIEYYSLLDNAWLTTKYPSWDCCNEYRVKPKVKVTVKYLFTENLEPSKHSSDLEFTNEGVLWDEPMLSTGPMVKITYRNNEVTAVELLKGDQQEDI